MPDENGNGLVPLREAAQRIGIASKTWRNALSRERANLPSRPLPPAQQIGTRWYVRLSDLEAFISTAGDGDGNGTHAELIEVADRIGKVFPAESQRLKSLALRIGGAP